MYNYHGYRINIGEFIHNGTLSSSSSVYHDHFKNRRYCLLNDSDSNLTPEDAFIVYMRHMRELTRLPPLCEPRREIVDRLLLDAQATDSLSKYWDLNWDIDIGYMNRMWFVYTLLFIEKVFIWYSLQRRVDWYDSPIKRYPILNIVIRHGSNRTLTIRKRLHRNSMLLYIYRLYVFIESIHI